MNQIEKIIDIATWNRREHYEHFSAFDDPFFGVTVQVDCTRAYQEAKTKGISFSLLVLHRITTAAAAVEEFRYRIEGDKVVCYDSLLPEATVTRSSFLHIGYNLQDFQTPNYLMLGLGFRFNNKYPKVRH